MEYYGNNDWRDYLAHHGIMNQKWGKRYGPPYPLDYGEHSAAEKRGMAEAGVKYRGKEGAVTTKPKKKLSSDDKDQDNKKQGMKPDPERAKLDYGEDTKRRRDLFNKAAKISSKLGYRDYAPEGLDKELDKIYDEISVIEMKHVRRAEGKTDTDSKNVSRPVSDDRARAEKTERTTPKIADKDQKLRRAKEHDEFRGDFLEAIQNEPWYNNKKKRLREYSKYLDDPYGYWEKGGGN